MNIENKPWHKAAALTVIMTIASGIGNYASSWLLLSVKEKEEMQKNSLDRKAAGEQLHCEKLRESASLAAEIEFSSDRGYVYAIHLTDLIRRGSSTQLDNDVIEKLKNEQLAFEKRASGLIPFLSQYEANILSNITLHHSVITAMRTSATPASLRIQPSQGGFDANEELDKIRNGASDLALSYRKTCTEKP
ncbi:hypothetical protein [Burkholderia pseudomallei]|uniref:hypothetical protein n=1 Tax=Burkholderia pseudomallei TaxID=28450 RepID=UPI002953D14E|nr:hypothetical protein [Burkholderia pseudomallei]